MTVVATISKLFRSETLAELVRAMPSISKMGAKMSSTTMATVQGSSLRVKGAGFFEPMLLWNRP